MELHSVLVTGANRGIGLEFVRQLTALPNPPKYVFATYRTAESLGPLNEIKNASKECQIILIKMDVKIPEDVVAARKIVEQTVGDEGLTLLINNAGVGKVEPFPNITEETMLYHFTINTVGPVRVLQPLTEIKNASKACEVILIKMDVKIPEDVVAARKLVEQTVGDNGLNLLINNAGVGRYEPFPKITEETMLYHFTTNTIGPVRVLQEMYPLLQKAASRGHTVNRMSVNRAAVLNMTSMSGSITRTGKEYVQDLVIPSYKASKAALNMVMRVISANVKDKGILVVMMCPGWVKTDMGTRAAEITAEESISAILKTLEKLDDSHHGTYMDRHGNLYPF